MSNDSRKPPTPPDVPEEEWVHEDDAVIGRAVRWSIMAFIAILIAVGMVVLVLRREPPPLPEQVTSLTLPDSPEHATAEIPRAVFQDVTKESGVDFVHVNGAYGQKLLPETMGGGVAVFDGDGDGDQDLLFINSAYWPWDESASDKTPPTLGFYRNDGTGHFENATAGSGLDVSLYGMGVAVGDYDNDGQSDLYVTAVGGNRLFHNEGGGKFRDVTAEAGAGGDDHEWSTSTTWFDMDNDGDLDLFVCNYVRWSKEIDLEVGFKLDGVNRAYGQPMDFQGTNPYLFRNEGDGRFTDVTKSSGLHAPQTVTGQPMAKSLGVAAVDIDGDGWMDLIVANDTVQNFLFHNQGDGTFEEIGALSGVAFDSYGKTRGAMGIDVARYRNDGSLGIAIGNFANEMSALFVSQNEPLLFSDEAIPEGIGPASRLLLKFGLFFFDYDLDGRLDMLTANGHLEEEITKIQASQSYRQPAQLFWNCGPGRKCSFVPVTAEQSGADLFQPLVGRGSAYGDLDGDGDLDVVLTQVHGPPLILRNDQALDHHWIRLRLVGTTSNRDAIGAWVELDLGDETVARLVTPTRSYLSQSELPVTIGLGDMEQVKEVRITWPDGSKQTVADVPVDRITTIKQAP